MQSHLRYGAVVLALLGSVGFAAAQSSTPGPEMYGPETLNTIPNAGLPAGDASMPAPGHQLNLSEQQRQAIWESIGRGAGARAPAGFAASVGTPLPNRIAVRPLPRRAIGMAPEATGYNYAKVQEQVLLVDPSTRTVVDVITQE